MLLKRGSEFILDASPPSSSSRCKSTAKPSYSLNTSGLHLLHSTSAKITWTELPFFRTWIVLTAFELVSDEAEPSCSPSHSSGIFSKHTSDDPHTIWCQQHNMNKIPRLFDGANHGQNSYWRLYKDCLSIFPLACSPTRLTALPFTSNLPRMAFAALPDSHFLLRSCLCFSSRLLDIVTLAVPSCFISLTPLLRRFPQSCLCNPVRAVISQSVVRSIGALSLHEDQNGLTSTWMSYMCFLLSKRGPLLC